jgi:hypothetical protein
MRRYNVFKISDPLQKLGVELFYNRGNYLHLSEKKYSFYPSGNNLCPDITYCIAAGTIPGQIVNSAVQQNRDAFEFVYVFFEPVCMSTTANIAHKMGREVPQTVLPTGWTTHRCLEMPIPTTHTLSLSSHRTIANEHETMQWVFQDTLATWHQGKGLSGSLLLCKRQEHIFRQRLGFSATGN